MSKTPPRTTDDDGPTRLPGAEEQPKAPPLGTFWERMHRAVDAIAQGAPDSHAAKLGPVSPSALWSWRRKGAKLADRFDEGERLTGKDHKHLRWYRRLCEAEAARSDTLKALVMTAVEIAAEKGDVRAVGWWAARVDPDVFGDPLQRERVAMLKLQREQLAKAGGGGTLVVVPSVDMLQAGDVSADLLLRVSPSIGRAEADAIATEAAEDAEP